MSRIELRSIRPLLVLVNMAVILVISLFGIQEIRNALITAPGYSDWTPWTTCTKTCNTGIKKRRRYCNNPPPAMFGPRNCSHAGPGFEVAPCSTNKCPIDGNFGPWSRFGNCTKQCGGGEQSRVRLCVNPAPQYGGRDCSILGKYKETTSCNEQSCSVNGGYSSWSSWSSCSKTCGPGQKERKRTCDNPLPQHNGKNCDSLGASKEVKECQIKECPVNGGYGVWEDWNECSATCGGGIRNRQRKCNRPAPQAGGKDCSSLGPSKEQEACGTTSCNVDGGYTKWSEWSSCSATCGEASRQRKRRCSNPKPSGTGKSCSRLGASREILDCDLSPCVVTE